MQQDGKRRRKEEEEVRREVFFGGAAFHAVATEAALGQQQQQEAEYGVLGDGAGGAFYESEAGGSLEPEPHETSNRTCGGGGSGNKCTRAAEVHNLSEKVMALRCDPFSPEFALLLCSSHHVRFLAAHCLPA
ncbi:hypothetical protein ZWY2020_048933 [Hordeum vulgare]|nr:hypothetical protein ZWY2020_048933 [Hordeum vulgare]